MKIITVLVISIVSLFLSQASAQTEVPKGLKKGTIILADGSSLPGFIKDNIRNNASAMFISETGGKKKKYDGSDLSTGGQPACQNAAVHYR
jgi:hypothetical protein